MCWHYDVYDVRHFGTWADKLKLQRIWHFPSDLWSSRRYLAVAWTITIAKGSSQDKESTNSDYCPVYFGSFPLKLDQTVTIKLFIFSANNWAMVWEKKYFYLDVFPEQLAEPTACLIKTQMKISFSQQLCWALSMVTSLDVKLHPATVDSFRAYEGCNIYKKSCDPH